LIQKLYVLCLGKAIKMTSKPNEKSAKTGKSPKGQKTNIRSFSPTAIPREILRLGQGWFTHASIGIPWKLARAVASDSSLVPWGDGKVFMIVGGALLGVIDAWGPLYGKAMQIWLSRLGKGAMPLIDSLKLDRVYGDWPPLGWGEVCAVLDREIPSWHDELKVELRPLGVASMSQVHGAVDLDGNRWVIKLLKPASMSRLTESIAAIESAMFVAEPFAMTRLSRRFLLDVRSLCESLRLEMNLDHERTTMLRVHQLIQSKGQKALRVPILHPRLASRAVIVMERLDGVKLSDLVSGKVEVSHAVRKTLARKLLGELLVQIFEWGLFHADPHAGNLMLLEDGTVGLYDWGLAGELLEADRRLIAGILKAVMAMDIERLINVLADMGEEAQGKPIPREKIRGELRKLTKIVGEAKAAGGPMPSIHVLINAALEGAERMGLIMPAGLLLMAKSLLTIEGLARGIDADVSFARVAGPVLFRASDPKLGDVLALAKQLPSILNRFLRKE
jgi:ubiquinone biosynthesis protein